MERKTNENKTINEFICTQNIYLRVCVREYMMIMWVQQIHLIKPK